MNNVWLSFSFPKIIVFSLLLFLSDIVIVHHLHEHQIQFAPVINASAVLPLLYFNAFPGMAALIVLVLFKQPITHLIAFNHAHFGYFILGFFIFPFFAFIAASGSVLFNLADWNFTMSDYFHDFHRQFNHNPIAQAWLQLTPERWQMWLLLIIITPIYTLIPSFIETIGWQGFYYRLCQEKGFWFCSITSGMLWWLWQVPIIILGHPYPYHPFIGLVIGLAFGVAMQTILNWLRMISGHLGPVILARTTLSSIALIPLMITSHHDRTFSHLHGLVGVVIMSFFIMLLIMFNLITRPKDKLY